MKSRIFFIHASSIGPFVLPTLQVGSFDKSQDLANVNDYIAKGGKMQVQWMVPEAIHHCQYSTASDIWSYGCLLYEIWSPGRMPFRDSSNAEVKNFPFLL